MIYYRPVQEQDFSKLSKILLELGYEVSPSDLKARISFIRLASGEIFVAERENELIGCIQALIDIRLAEGRVGEIVSLVVSHSARGQGIGKQLVQTAEEFLADNGCKTIRIRANKIREQAHQFYRSQGYREKKEQKVFLKY